MSINIDYLFLTPNSILEETLKPINHKGFFLTGSLIRNCEKLLSNLFGEVRATFPRLNLC